MKGLYSVIQYIPDRSSGDAAAVGVVLFVPSDHYLGVKMAPIQPRVNAFFGLNEQAVLNLEDTKKSMHHRIVSDTFETVESLTYFIQTRANSLLLTNLRSIRVTDDGYDDDLERLYNETIKL